MAESLSKIDAAAEKAFAEAAEKKTSEAVAKPAAAAPAPVAAAPVVKAEAAPQTAAAPATAPKAKPVARKAALKKAARKAVAKPVSSKVERKAIAKPAAKKTPVRKVPTKKPARVAAKTFKPTTTITQLKDKIMATTKTADFTKTAQDAVAELQSRAKAAYEKGTEITADVTAFHKGNFDAVVESGKILAAGMQDMGRKAVEEAKSAAETVTADVKAIAAVKSPTELFQLQGEIARRNLDTLVAKTSKNAEVFMKLANDAFAPLSSRASVAMEKLTKAA